MGRFHSEIVPRSMKWKEGVGLDFLLLLMYNSLALHVLGARRQRTDMLVWQPVEICHFS